ncbi:MAG: SPASM domain-containing protein [Candidatus Woesearchaeota archaeon]
MKKGVMIKKDDWKYFLSEDVNNAFNMVTGYNIMWGKTKEETPKYSPYGPFIMDLEVSTVCSGTDHGPCKHCYKSNTPKGKNMSFETFKEIFNKMPKTLTQIAFGIGDLDANKDLIKMFEYCRNNEHNPNVIPNITINGYGLTNEWINILAKYCGGVAVSLYHDKDVCYNAIERLSKAGLKQCNIHQVIAIETIEKCHELIEDAANDSRLIDHLKSIMFLTLKPKGKRNRMNIVKDVNKYKGLIDHAMDNRIQIGFDSCSAPIFLQAMKYDKNFNKYVQMVESCESGLFSSYINVDGIYWHCSFTEDQPGWKGVNVLDKKDFMEVWNDPETIRFRKKLIEQDNSHICNDCRLCPVYDLYHEDIGNASNTIYQPIFELKAEHRLEMKT